MTTFMLLLLLILTSGAMAGESHHPLHEKFYSTWMRPDAPWSPCCKGDCYPTASRLVDGKWQAQRREDGKWLPIPWEKIERNRDNPDGRSHLCAPPANRDWPHVIVFCFQPGTGF